METKNLCAQIPLELHAKVRAEQEKSGLTLGAYITEVRTKFYEKGDVKMNDTTRTLAFQIPDELFWRIKDHLTRETERTGKRFTQRDFVLGLIKKALDEAEQAEANGSDAESDTDEEATADSEAERGTDEEPADDEGGEAAQEA